MIARSRSLARAHTAIFVMAAAALVTGAVATVVLVALTHDSPIRVSDRSLGALLAWSTGALALATVALFVAAVWAGVQVADATRRAVLAPVVLMELAPTTVPNDYTIEIGGVTRDAIILSLGPGPVPIGRAWIWIFLHEGETEAPVGRLEGPSGEPTPRLDEAEAHYWTTYGNLPPAGVAGGGQVRPWRRTGEPFPDYPDGGGIYDVWYRVDYRDVFDKPQTTAFMYRITTTTGSVAGVGLTVHEIRVS